MVDEIKARNEIVSVVEQYVRLEKRSGANFFGLCPFHSEDTPSFSVSPNKQIFYCFGCHKGGNVIQFVREVEKCSWPQAIQILAERAGIKLPEPDDEAYRRRAELHSAIQQIYLEAARYYYLNLTGDAGGVARQYLNQRGLGVGIARKFGLGYAPDEWDGLLRHLQSKGFTDPALLEKTGLFKHGKQSGLYDLFRHRLVFPILDVMNRVIAFGGRVLDNGQPKYINSPETAIYTKGKHLYGLNLAKNSREKQLVLVEGYMDAIAMHQAGIDYAVAILGTALTENQAQLLRKYTENVIVGFDADAAGQAAALRSLDLLTARGLKVTVLQVPEGKDPDEYIRRNGPERFRALIDQALPLLDFKLLVARRQHTVRDQLDILGFQDEACQILTREENGIVRELYAAKVAEILHTSPESVLREIDRRLQQSGPGRTAETGADQLRQQLQQRRTGSGGPGGLAAPAGAAGTAGQSGAPDADSPETSVADKASREEIYLLSLLAAEPTIYANLAELPQVTDFSAGTMRAVAAIVLDSLARGETVETSRLIELGEDRTIHHKPLTDLLARASMKLEETFQKQDLNVTASELIRKCRRQQLIVRRDQLARQADDRQDPAAAREAMATLLQIRRQIDDLRDR